MSRHRANSADGDRAAKGGSGIETLHPVSLKYLSRTLTSLVRGRLWLQVLVAMALGLGLGVLIGPSVGWVAPETASLIAAWLALPGQLFLALIQMIVIPLVFASIIRGLAASEDIDQLRRLGSVVVTYFIVTTAVAIVIGLALASVIEPGRLIDGANITGALAPPTETEAGVATLPSLAELPSALVNILPSNPLTSMVSGDMLQVVIFAMIMGGALVLMRPEQAKPLLEVLGTLQEVCMIVVRIAMRLAPIAVFGLLAQLTAKIGLGALVGMAVYVGTVLLGLALVLVLYLVIVAVFGRRSPVAFMRACREVVLLAFSTSSSAAVMPLSIETAEEKLKLRPSVVQFVIPVGATLNMNGTALYQGVATVFLAQVFNVDITLSGMALVVITAVGASIGSPATPGVGIVILSMVLNSVGIPPAGIALIMGVDRILDMSRTAVNVVGDLVAAVLMDQWIGGPTPLSEIHAVQTQANQLEDKTGETVFVAEDKT